MIRLILHNWRYKLLAFVCAVFVYRVYVRAEAEPTFVSLRVPVRAVNLPHGLEPSLLPSIIAGLEGPKESVEALLSRPDGGVAEVDASVDLSGKRAGTWDLPVTIKVNSPRMRVAEKAPYATVKLEPIERRDLDIEVVPLGRVRTGYRWEATSAEREKAAVQGPRSVVEQVQRLEARVMVYHAAADVVRDVPIEAIDSGEKPLKHPGLTIFPEQVSVRVRITRVLENKVVPVTLRLTGQPAPGLRVASAQVDPLTVTLSGSRAALERVQAVSTEPLDLGGAFEPVVRQVRLQPPPGVQTVEVSSARVKVFFMPAPEETTAP